MDELTRHEDRLPYCDCHACAIYERDRLRAELAADRTCKESLLVALESLRAELAKCMVLLDQAYKALKYHREQTRPIHETDEVIAAIEAARKGEGE